MVGELAARGAELSGAQKGADRGIDGIIYFRNGPWGVGETVVSVKGGENVNPAMVSALSGTVAREQAQMGILASLEVTQGMRREAAGYGFVDTAQGRFQKIQVVTIEELLSGRYPAMPRPIESEAFRRPLRPARAEKKSKPDAQLALQLRCKVALVLALMKMAHRRDVGRHPGLLFIDTPRQPGAGRGRPRSHGGGLGFSVRRPSLPPAVRGHDARRRIRGGGARGLQASCAPRRHGMVGRACLPCASTGMRASPALRP